MLPLPQSGVAVSVNQHNCSLDVVCDWLEASSVLGEEEISRSDARDVLLEEQVYRDQDFAGEFLESTWMELRRRIGHLPGSAPLVIEKGKIAGIKNWKDAAAQCFLLLLSLGPHYAGWHETFGPDYTEQGELFELLVEEAMRALLPAWVVVRTGWSSRHAARLSDVVGDLSKKIGVSIGEPEKWAGERANESGVDVVFFRPFVDGRGGNPIYLAQCASGADWWKKLHTPELSVWQRVLIFPHTPGKAFAIPFSLDSSAFLRRCNQANAVFLDRYRLLEAGEANKRWLSDGLRQRLIRWLEPKIEWLGT